MTSAEFRRRILRLMHYPGKVLSPEDERMAMNSPLNTLTKKIRNAIAALYMMRLEIIYRLAVVTHKWSILTSAMARLSTGQTPALDARAYGLSSAHADALTLADESNSLLANLKGYKELLLRRDQLDGQRQELKDDLISRINASFDEHAHETIERKDLNSAIEDSLQYADQHPEQIREYYELIQQSPGLSKALSAILAPAMQKSEAPRSELDLILSNPALRQGLMLTMRLYSKNTHVRDPQIFREVLSQFQLGGVGANLSQVEQQCAQVTQQLKRQEAVLGTQMQQFDQLSQSVQTQAPQLLSKHLLQRMAVVRGLQKELFPSSQSSPAPVPTR